MGTTSSLCVPKKFPFTLSTKCDDRKNSEKLRNALISNPLVIAKIEVDGTVDCEALDTLIQLMDQSVLAKGADLFVQGDKADSLFILVGGELEQTDNNNTKLHLTPVHCFGEKGLTSNAPRTTTVRATKESILYRLERKNFEFACSNIEKRYAFARIPIFATLDKRDDLTYFYKHSKITSFGKGDKIVTSKEIYGQFFHVLLSGSALTENGELIEAYDFFGHEALFHKLPHEKPYDYAVTAGENVQILTLDSESFKSSRFEFVRNIIRAKAELKELKGSLQTVPIQQLEFLQDYGSGNLIGSDDDIMSSLWDAMINEPFLYFQPPPEEGSGSSNQNIREASCTLS